MGMEDPRPERFIQMMENYEQAIARKDQKTTAEGRLLLSRALHPSSVIRQIIDIESI